MASLREQPVLGPIPIFPRQLDQHIETAIRHARELGTTVLASVTEALPEPLDPTAVVIASRIGDEPWSVLEQPDRQGSALATLGCVRRLEARGPDRFHELADRWSDTARSAVARGSGDGPAGAGLVAVGGFAFGPQAGTGEIWTGFAAASMLVPEVSLYRFAGNTWLTINLQAAPEDTVDSLRAAVERRLSRLITAPLPLLDPSPAGRYRVHSPLAPSHYEEAVARAVHRIRAGELKKIVLAREVEVHAPVAHHPAAVLGVLRESFPSCLVYAVGRGASTFLGATPELLIRRDGARASTVALAGSIRRSADPAVNDHLGEQLLRSEKDRQENGIVAQRISSTLRPHAVWVTVPDEPALVQVANIQHLALPIRAQLARPLDALRLAGLLHPTPAVGGEPWSVAEPLLPALEGFDRGWYAGPVGWIDSAGDGEFCVALRCALLRGTTARLFAGAGVVADSDPAAELAETEVKLGALLPVLSG